MPLSVRPHTVLAALAGSLFFGAGFFFFAQTNEPVELVVNDTFTPIEIVTQSPATSPSLPIEAPETAIEEEVEDVPLLEQIPQEEAPALAPIPTEERQTPVAQTFVPKELEAAHARVQEALVNILCIASGTSPVNSISGSGVIIDPSGTILTNAHIAEHFLLKDYPVENSIVCTIRTESPAKDAYTAELAYISPRWIFENKKALTQSNPTGTGKDDFALLTITGATEYASLPEIFPYIPVSFAEQAIGNIVISAGYPASFLKAEAVRRNLAQIASVGTVEDIFTFNQTTVDVLSLGGVPLAQQGASGGAVVGSDGSLVGLIVTSSLEGNTQERDLRAISTAHIFRSFTEQHGLNFGSYAFGDISPEHEEFRTQVAPTLTELLVEELKN
jgi:S1-C subfamily serine protease